MRHAGIVGGFNGTLLSMLRVCLPVPRFTKRSSSAVITVAGGRDAGSWLATVSRRVYGWVSGEYRHQVILAPELKWRSKAALFHDFNDHVADHRAQSQRTHRPFDGWSLDERSPQVIRALLPLGEWLHRYYFRVTTDGWQHLPTAGSMLIVGSHNGGMIAPDTLMFMVDWFRQFGVDRPVYGLMHPNVWLLPDYARLTVELGAVKAHPKMAIAALKRGAAVLVYPGGAQDLWRPHKERHRIHLAGHQGFIKLALRESVPIVPAISKGAHDTLIVLADYYKELRQLHDWGLPWLFGFDPLVFPIYLGLPWGLAIGPLPNIPLPVPIHTRLCAPIVFERYGRAAALDRAYVDDCYAKVVLRMQLELDRLVQGQSGLSGGDEPENSVVGT